MTRRFLIVALVSLAVGAATLWLFYAPVPEIRFIEFRYGQHGRVAVFRISNDSGSTYSYAGYSPVSPRYSLRIPTASGWQPHSHGSDCSTSLTAQTISPHSAMEIEIANAPSSPFSLGIHFERGEFEQLRSIYWPRSRISEFFDWVHYRINPKYKGPEPTWSTVAQTK